MATSIIANPWSVDLDNNNTLNGNKLASSGEKRDTSIERVWEIARKELREDENTRRECLEHLRNWIKQNADIENCFTDDKFLLRFLRVKKFSIPMAEQTLLKYLNFRKRFRHFMYNMDYLDGKIHEILNNGYIYASPYRDSNGRRVILYDMSKFDPHKYNSTDMSRVHAITYETILNDEKNQILGINHVGDLNGINPAFVTIWSISEFATIIRWGEQSFPMRHKEINVVNMPTALKYIYDFVQSNIKSQKLKDRFTIHGCLDELHNKVDKRCLPLELGGVMPAKEMVQLWREELAANRECLLSYDCMNLLSDEGIITSKNAPAQDDTGTGSLAGSFRKLNLD